MRSRTRPCSLLVTCASALALPLALGLTVLAPREARA